MDGRYNGTNLVPNDATVHPGDIVIMLCNDWHKEEDIVEVYAYSESSDTGVLGYCEKTDHSWYFNSHSCKIITKKFNTRRNRHSTGKSITIPEQIMIT